LVENDPETFDIVFLDPPFGGNLVVQTCHRLEEKGWLSGHAKIYLEAESADKFSENMPNQWKLLKSKRAGDVGFGLCQRL
jgi:16S rRNA (guanine966-N2)-methyltransferase